ncbi:MAG: hypothetical protein AAB776_01540, partial [Patescibacteria group bacterium]
DAVAAVFGGGEDPALTEAIYADCPGAADPVATPVRDALLPNLNVKIPGLCDDKGICWKGIANDIKGDYYESNLIGLYVEAVYTYLLTAAAIIAVTMIMIGGLQYATARGDTKQVEHAKKRISSAVMGVILLLLAYNIAFIINPSTTTFRTLSIQTIDTIRINKDLDGPDGLASIHGGPGPWTNLKPPYLDIVTAAKAGGTCEIPEGLASPIGPQTPGVLPNQGNHHWYDKGANGDFTKIFMLDWASSWGTEILAPFNGTVTYEKSTRVNKCGNKITLKGSNTTVYICHVKDFLDAEGNPITGSVVQGQVIGHVGGECCAASDAPNNGYVTSCDVAGTACDPNSSASCTCQPIEQAGNTTGPHVHLTMDKGPSNILHCLK